MAAEPLSTKSAVKGLLRFDSPVQMTSRTATEDIEIESATCKRDASIIVRTATANRDDAIFEHRDRLPSPGWDITLGSLPGSTAVSELRVRLEAHCAFEASASGVPRLRLAGKPTPTRRASESRVVGVWQAREPEKSS